MNLTMHIQHGTHVIPPVDVGYHLFRYTFGRGNPTINILYNVKVGLPRAYNNMQRSCRDVSLGLNIYVLFFLFFSFVLCQNFYSCNVRLSADTC